MEFYSKILLCLSLFLTLVMTATGGAAVEPPRRVRSSRSHHGIKMAVNPDMHTMRYGDVIKIKCRARGGGRVEDMPFLSFYRQLDPHTVLPMSSGFPGVTIEAIAPGRAGRSPKHNRAIKYMKLGPEVWETLYPGSNVFYCRSYNMKGVAESVYFTIYKV